MPDVQQGDGEERVGPVRSSAKLIGEAHEVQGEGGEHRDLEQHPGAEVVREREEREVHGPREREPVLVVLLPEPRQRRFFAE